MTTPDTPTLDLDTQIFESQFREEKLRIKETALLHARCSAIDAARTLRRAVEQLGVVIGSLSIASTSTLWTDTRKDEINRILHIARCNLSQLMQRHAAIQKEVAEAITPAEEAVQEALAEQNRKTGQLMEARSTTAAARLNS